MNVLAIILALYVSLCVVTTLGLLALLRWADRDEDQS